MTSSTRTPGRRTSVRAAVAALLVALALVGGTAGAADRLPVPYNFLSSAVLAGTQPNASPPGANLWSCRPTARHPRPVVLVHGLLGNKNTNWQTFAPLLKNHGYCVYALTYGVAPGTPTGADQFGGLTRMESSARQLAAFVTKVRRATGAAQVDLLGHSEGTLMPNYYVKFLGGARYVHSYVSLAPLWHGTSAGGGAQLNQAATVFGIDPATNPGCSSCAEFAPDSAFMRKMRTGAVAVRGVRYTNIVTKYDELVTPYTSGIQAGMRNYVVQAHCAQDATEHFEIAADPVAAGYVLNALDPAHPHPVPCMAVLPFEGPVG